MRANDLVEHWDDDPDGGRETLARQPDTVGAAIASAGAAAPVHAVLDDAAVCFAVQGANGAILWTDARFASWVGADFQSLSRRDGPISFELVDQSGRAPVLVATVARRTAIDWTLPPAAATALGQPQASRLLAAVWSGGSELHLTRAGAAFGLTGLEARIVAALIIAGDLRAAAARARVSYGTARVALKSAMTKAGARRQSVLVARIARAAAAPVAAGDEAACLRDMFGLSLREARLAADLAASLTRAEAAAAAGISEALAKDALNRVFRRLHVKNAAQLSRLCVEARAMAALARPSRGKIVVNLSQHEPLQFIPRPDGTFIAISDFGPQAGWPAMLLHQVTMTRYPSRPLLAALQAAGFRPITIDRPGYGLTDLAHAASDDPFADAADDMALTANALRLAQVDIIARTGAHVALAFARRHSARTRRVVLLSPDPLLSASGKRSGVFGVLKDILVRHPVWIEPLARLMASQATPARVTANLERALRDSPADAAVMREPGNIEDYQRGVLMLATGQLTGMVREQRAFSLASPPEPLPCAKEWRVLIGAQDPISAHEDMSDYWRRLLPGAVFDFVVDGGRFLHLSHLPLVMAALGPPPAR